jgi:hypothetical protein
VTRARTSTPGSGKFPFLSLNVTTPSMPEPGKPSMIARARSASPHVVVTMTAPIRLATRMDSIALVTAAALMTLPLTLPLPRWSSAPPAPDSPLGRRISQS